MVISASVLRGSTPLLALTGRLKLNAPRTLHAHPSFFTSLSHRIILWSRSASVSVLPWSSFEWKHSDLAVTDGPLKDPIPEHPQGDVPDNYINGTSGRPTDINISSPILRAHLQALLNAPVLSHSDAVVKNEEGCPRVLADKQANQAQLHSNMDKWLTVDGTEIRTRRQAIVQYLQQLEEDGTTVLGAGSGEGRGVVMTAGNKHTAQTALVTLRMLRLEFRSELPVQIFSFPGEIEDKAVINAMRDLGATHHDLPGLQKATGVKKNFHIKAAAIIASKFAEVLYLDSDNVPLRDPAYLFDEPVYKNGSGAVFWPDYNKDHPDNAVWRVLGKTCNYTEWEFESGQILIDKRGNDGLNLAALHVASHMQINHDFWFSLSFGDKDTFRYAFWALSAPYVAAPRWLSALGSSFGRDAMVEGNFCGYVMLQYDIAKNERGEYLPLFLHANLVKHRYSWRLTKTPLFQTIKRASRDGSNEPSLDRTRVWAYEDWGWCVDLAVDATSDDKGEVEQEQRLLTEQFSDAYSGVFKDVEEKWLRAGGKQGGW
ncbi:glycosyltransferase family 71 protein [Ramaria rubella]|nr:glycosyltransferase family 71 protein [Ramaria rubella]